MEYDKLDLRFPWRFFQGKNIITADSILYCTRNLERNITKDYSKEKASWQKDKEKILGLQIKWKKKFSISKNQACQHKHFIAHRKELSFNKPLLGRGLKKKRITVASLLALIIDTLANLNQNCLNSSSWAEEHTSCSTYYEDLLGGHQKSYTIDPNPQ